MHDDKVNRFRCTVGHAYSERSLLADQNDVVERALWVAVRTLEERARLLENMARSAGGRGGGRAQAMYQERLDEALEQVRQLRSLLLRGGVIEAERHSAQRA